MNLKKLLKSKRRAAAIPLAIIAVMILLALGAGLHSLGMNARVYSARTASNIAARCAADTGLTVALFEMNRELQATSLVAFTSLGATDVQLPHLPKGRFALSCDSRGCSTMQSLRTGLWF